MQLNGVIIIPQPAHHSGTGSNVPTQYVIGYIVIAALVWAATAVIATRSKDRCEPIEAVLIGSIAAMVWPLVLAALPIWGLVKAIAPKR